MPKIYGQLERAQFENVGALPTAGIVGRVVTLTTDNRVYHDDGTVFRAMLRNDGSCLIGNSGTANNNIRFHRGANGVLQLVTGGDVTSEGTLSTSLNQLSARLENYTDAGKPAVGNAGRVIYVTDLQTLLVDTGAVWNAISGGGGGGSLQWTEDAMAPLPFQENFVKGYAFKAGESQSLYALVRVPDSYSPGRQIRLKTNFYSPDSSGTALIQSIATLIRKEVDQISSTTNQRTSTNSAVTLSAGTVDEPQEVSLDLTSSTGQINSVAVSKGDLIIVKLTRGTDTATSDLKALVYGSEVLLS